MSLIDKLAERHIQDAQRRGEFDNLPGAGKPLVLEDDSLVPEELRAGYRLLKNAGYLPPELQLRNEINKVEQLLACVKDEGQREQAHKKLRLLKLRLNLQRGDGIDYAVERQYRDKLFNTD